MIKSKISKEYLYITKICLFFEQIYFKFEQNYSIIYLNIKNNNFYFY